MGKRGRGMPRPHTGQWVLIKCPHCLKKSSLYIAVILLLVQILITFLSLAESCIYQHWHLHWRISDAAKLSNVAIFIGPIFLQCFDTVGWVIWPVRTRPRLTYNVFGGTLNFTQSINHMHQWLNYCERYTQKSIRGNFSLIFCITDIYMSPFWDGVFTVILVIHNKNLVIITEIIGYN